MIPTASAERPASGAWPFGLLRVALVAWSLALAIFFLGISSPATIGVIVNPHAGPAGGMGFFVLALAFMASFVVVLLTVPFAVFSLIWRPTFRSVVNNVTTGFGILVLAAGCLYAFFA